MNKQDIKLMTEAYDDVSKPIGTNPPSHTPTGLDPATSVRYAKLIRRFLDDYTNSPEPDPENTSGEIKNFTDFLNGFRFYLSSIEDEDYERQQSGVYDPRGRIFPND